MLGQQRGLIQQGAPVTVQAMNEYQCCAVGGGGWRDIPAGQVKVVSCGKGYLFPQVEVIIGRGLERPTWSGVNESARPLSDEQQKACQDKQQDTRYTQPGWNPFQLIILLYWSITL